MSDDNDARYLITNAVMPRLESLDRGMDKIFTRIDTICTTQTDLMVTDETIRAKIASVEMMNANTQKDIQELKVRLDEHKKDLETHYNPYYGETYWEKMGRKKPEIVTGVSLSTLLSALVVAILKAMEVI